MIEDVQQAGPARIEPSPLLRSSRVIAVLRAAAAEAYLPVVEVLVDAGVVSIELTLSTPGTIAVIGELVARFHGRAEIGVGTVLTAADAESALAAGAAYLVTPTVAPKVVAAAVRSGRPVYPGAFTPTEVHRNWTAGASAVKIFPASVVGPGYLSALRGPFPAVDMVPSGGVTPELAPDWLRAGAVAVSLGGELVGDALRGGDLHALASRAAHVRRLVDEVR